VKAGVTLRSSTTEAALDSYAEARIVGLRSALAILAALTFVAFLFTRRIPTTQIGAAVAATER
jgi:hypothetical protein